MMKSIPGYDAWKTRGPEEREYFISCDGDDCGEELDIAYGAKCENCGKEHDAPEPPEPDRP